MLAPLVKTIEVPCNQEKAFKVFITEMHSWWPLAKFTVSAMRGAPAQTIRVDARPGGEIVEIGPDNSEYLWGTIKSYDPYDFVSMSFHIPQPGEKVKDRSLVEIRFTVLDEQKTRVELTQSNWEVFGERARDLQGGYGGGWAMIFEQAYKAACGG
jgi:uncharacterized protein YndB with AHSA1/START domain